MSDLSKPNILIVDDDPVQLEYLEVLVSTNAIPVAATSGYTGIEKAQSYNFALAIMDVKMPGMNGYEFAVALNRDRKNDKIPVIFLTSGAVDQQQLLEGYAAGAVDYIPKPVNKYVLQSKINIFIDLFRQKQLVITAMQELVRSSENLAKTNIALQKSEKKFRSYVDNAPDGVFIANENGKYVEVNQAACRITGYSENELLTMSIGDILTEETLADGQQHFMNLVSNGFATGEFTFRHKNGTKRWWLVDAVKLSDTRFLGFTKDITHRKMNEEALYQSEKNYEHLVNSIHESLTVISRDGVFLFANQKAARNMCNGSPEDITGRCVSDFVPQLQANDLLKTYKEVLVSGEPLRREINITFASGSKWFFNTLYPITYGDNNEPVLLSISLDITERKNAEIAILESQQFTEKIINSIPVSVFWKDKNLVYQGCNKSFAQYAGFDNTSYIIGKNDNQLPWFEYAQQYQCDDLEIIETGLPKLNYEEPLILPDGRTLILHTSKIPHFDLQGDIIGVIGAFLDITEHKEIMKALQKSEELFRSVVFNSLDLTVLTDAEGIIVFMSPQCESVIGYPNGSFIGEKMPKITHPEDTNLCRENHDMVLFDGKELKDFEYRIIDKKGITRWISHSAKPVKVNDSLIGIQNTIRNITDRKNAEQALKVSEEKYRTMLNASPDGIFITNLKGIITDVSEIGLELFGSDNRNDLIGKHFWRFIPHHEKPVVKEIIEKTLNEGLLQNIEIQIRKKNQTLFLSETSSTLIQGPDGAPVSFMIIIRDISLRKRIEKKQIHSDRMASLGEMASGIAHEINQPLNTISLALDNVVFEAQNHENIDKEYLKKKSDKIFENISRIRNIIDHVRAFSSSHDDYVLTGFDINTSIKNAVSMISEQFKHRGINLHLQLEENLPMIPGNTFKFEQVILNLLSNAKDAVLDKKNMLPEAFEMMIQIRSFHENGNIHVNITDNGAGISEEDIDHIMLPFYTTKDAGKGTGLGLSISYQIIKEMNGSIEISSTPNQGTTFKIILKNQNK